VAVDRRHSRRPTRRCRHRRGQRHQQQQHVRGRSVDRDRGEDDHRHGSGAAGCRPVDRHPGQDRYRDREAGRARRDHPGDGLFLVGVDVRPGTYRNAGGENCYWARLRSTSGELGAIIANDNPTGPTVVTIRSTDKAFETSNCATWQRIG
jgi:hypothetical protein